MGSYDHGRQPYDDVRAMVEGLGLKLGKEEWRYKDWVETTIRDGRRPIARLTFFWNSYYADLKVQPMEGSTTMAGEHHIDRPERLEKALAEVEGLLRTYQVMKKRLPYEDYPSDRSLKAWLDGVASQCSDRPKFKPVERRSREILSSIEAVRKDFDRPTALRLQRRLAGMVADHGDAAMSYMVRSAISMADRVYGVHALSWATGSNQSHFLQVVPPAPERHAIEEEPSAPALR